MMLLGDNIIGEKEGRSVGGGGDAVIFRHVAADFERGAYMMHCYFTIIGFYSRY